MEKSSFSTIKYDSITEILNLIINQEKISRSEIAAETGLSLMTVGKAADALLNSGIIIQSKETRSAAGRKTELINLNPLYFSIILDLKEKPFHAYIITPNRLFNDIKNRIRKMGINLLFTYTPENPPSIIGIAHLLRLNWFDKIPVHKKL